MIVEVRQFSPCWWWGQLRDGHDHRWELLYVKHIDLFRDLYRLTQSRLDSLHNNSWLLNLPTKASGTT